MSAGRRELPPETFDKPCFDKTSVFCYEGVTFKMEVPGWLRYLIVMTVRVVPNAHRGCPVEQLHLYM